MEIDKKVMMAELGGAFVVSWVVLGMNLGHHKSASKFCHHYFLVYFHIFSPLIIPSH